MKYWLIVMLINPSAPADENFVGKFEMAYESKAQCELALQKRNYKFEFYLPKDDTFAVVDPNFKPDCYSDNHVRGIAQDPGKRYD
jgi:hypothetical protein